MSRCIISEINQKLLKRLCFGSFSVCPEIYTLYRHMLILSFNYDICIKYFAVGDRVCEKLQSRKKGIDKPTILVYYRHIAAKHINPV